MKNFFEKLFDLLYDYIDYIVILAIVVVVVAIIGWRLDLIFTDDGTGSRAAIEEEHNNQDNEDDQVDDEIAELPESPETDPDEEDESMDEVDDSQDTDSQPQEDVEIDIPSGTLPSGIGQILVENHLIESNDDFLSLVEEKNLETGLKAGVYIIPSGSSLDEILEILTN